MDNESERPKRERPELTELKLLLERRDNTDDPEEKRQLERQIEEMEAEIKRANDR